jgi:hypothetical protein
VYKTKYNETSYLIPTKIPTKNMESKRIENFITWRVSDCEEFAGASRQKCD